MAVALVATARISSRWRSTGLTIAVTLNVVGLNVGKWLNNVGALASWIPAAAADRCWRRFRGSRFGSATPIDAQRMVPSTSLKDVIFWSTIAFAFGGVESGSTMGEEIQDARRTVPRAILTAGAAMITFSTSSARSACCWRFRASRSSGLQGIHAGDADDDREDGDCVAGADVCRVRDA